MEDVLARCGQACDCGEKHLCTVREALVAPGAFTRLPSLLAELGWKHPVMICDENTYTAAGAALVGLIPGLRKICLSPDQLHADERGVRMVELALPSGTDGLLAVGAGTIHDLTRYVGHKHFIPFVSVPTAASVDGFVSTVAAMTWQGCKQTFAAVAPVAVLADTNVFAAAPRRLTASGVGDMLGKYIALADWRVSALVSDEYLCESVFRMETDALLQVMNNLRAIGTGSPQGCELLMRGLLLSGLAMQMVNNSRPASGAEHHLAHLWEMEVLNPPLDALHGERVGVGLLLCAGAYEAFANMLRMGRLVSRPYGGLDKKRVETYFSVRPGMAEQIIAENTPSPLARLTTARLMERRQEVLDALVSIPSVAQITEALKMVGAPTSLKAIGLPDHVADLSMRLAPYVRRRLTLLRICYLFEGHPISPR